MTKALVITLSFIINLETAQVIEKYVQIKAYRSGKSNFSIKI